MLIGPLVMAQQASENHSRNGFRRKGHPFLMSPLPSKEEGLQPSTDASGAYSIIRETRGCRDGTPIRE